MIDINKPKGYWGMVRFVVLFLLGFMIVTSLIFGLSVVIIWIGLLLPRWLAVIGGITIFIFLLSTLLYYAEKKWG